MRSIALTLVLSSLVGVASADDRYDLSGIKLNPGERIIAINGVPVNGEDGVVQASATESSARPPAPVVPEEDSDAGSKSDSQTKEKQAAPVETNIVGNLVRTNQPFSHTPGETALEKANYERRRNGVGKLRPDPALQRLALRKAKIAAARGIRNHIGGSLGGARAEGVGHTNGRFLSCCLDMHATFGGAAMVKGADGWYCCLLVR